MAGSLDSDLLRTFVAIADHGSFSRAGAVVGRSQSAVSLQMKRLEDTAGCSLFRRQSHGVTLTVRGQGLLRHARGILRLIERAAGELNGEAVAGTVRLGIDRESVVEGKSVSVRVELGGRGNLKKKNKENK